MFQSLTEPLSRRIKIEAETVAMKYAGRAAVAVPFALAAGFAVIGLTIALSYAVGPAIACLIVAAVFAIAGTIGLLMVQEEEHRQQVRLFHAREKTIVSVPPIVPLLSLAGPGTLFTVFRTARRMSPLLVVTLILGGLLLARKTSDGDVSGDARGPVPAE